MTQHLGKLAKLEDSRNLRLENYVAAATPIPPLHRAWSPKGKQWGRMLNDRLGCCTVSAQGHAVQVWSANDGMQFNVPDSEIEKGYSAIGGYVPGDPSTDNGAHLLDAIKYLRSPGLAGHHSDAFVEADVRDARMLRLALSWFGCVVIGLRLPNTAKQEDVWSRTDGAPGSWGGHAVTLVDVDPFCWTCITWGRLQRMTHAFLARYCDEAYAQLSAQDWTGPDQRAPNGLLWDELLHDLEVVTR